MRAWEKYLPELVLACDIWYPQFPQVKEDSTFDDSPIKPQERCLLDVLGHWNSVKGVRADEPSLCCLTHIYPASLEEVLKELEQGSSLLPYSFIPTNMRSLVVLREQHVAISF